ncbi:phosphotransferase [Patescibacteria group bacterium]
MHKFQDRIGTEKNITPLLEGVCSDYGFGNYDDHEVVPVGYEDFNVIVSTGSSKYFLKLFATFRDDSACQAYVDIMYKAVEVGVHHPKLYKNPEGYLYKKKLGDTELRLCAMEYIDGKSLYDTNSKVTEEEARFLVRQAALINRMQIEPRNVDDSWAIVHFLEEYKKNAKYLAPDDNVLIKPLAEKFQKLDVGKLPHCLVHGDIIKTNVMKDTSGDLRIIDFSVADLYPRIQELAVLLCNILFDEGNPESFSESYRIAIDEYQKHIKLSTEELKAIPLFVKVAHAMHVICATKEKETKGNDSKENRYWISLGQKGLSATKNWNG